MGVPSLPCLLFPLMCVKLLVVVLKAEALLKLCSAFSLITVTEHDKSPLLKHYFTW